jgi:hypothetical protein
MNLLKLERNNTVGSYQMVWPRLLENKVARGSQKRQMENGGKGKRKTDSVNEKSK